MGITNFDALSTRVVDVVATAGGGKTNAATLSSGSNASSGQAGAFRITTVATAGDSVKLPSSSAGAGIQPGLALIVVNEGANSAQVFGSDTDTINGVATATGVAQASGVSAIYVLMGSAGGAGDWRRILSA